MATNGLSCIKTGGWLHLEQYGEYIRGDIFSVGPYLLMRANSVTRTSECPEEVFATMSNVFQIFDPTSEICTILGNDVVIMNYVR